MAGESRRLVGLLAEPARLKVVGAIALGARLPSEIAELSGLDLRVVGAALRRLEAGGLVSTVDGVVELDAAQFGAAARAETPPRPVEDHGVSDPAAAAVLRTFLRDGRLLQVPAARGKRRVVLEHIVTVFEPGERYPEMQVNALLRAWHPDYAALRRHLVDEDLLSRDGGVYWRTGGWVDVAEARLRRVQRLAAYVLVDGDPAEILLTRVSRGAAAGLWTLPGGGVEFGERPAAAAVREVREETGLDVQLDELLDVDSEHRVEKRRGEPLDWHAVRVLYRGSVLGGTLGVLEQNGSTDAVEWFRRSEVDSETVVPMVLRVLRTGRLGGE